MTAERIFHYRAVTTAGTVVTGAIPGETIPDVAHRLLRQGLTPVHVGDGANASKPARPAFQFGKRRCLLFFTEQLSILLGSGVPLDRALSLTADAAESASIRTLVTDVLKLVKSGKSMADSLAAHPRYFSQLHINMVRAGELSGSLAEIFERLAEFERTHDELRSFVTSAMLYPSLLSIVGLGSILVLLEFVIPRFAAVFESSHIALPLPMLMLLAVSDFLHSWSGVLAAACGLAGLASFCHFRSARGRLFWDGLRLQIPLLGESLRKAETSRFARAMGTLAANGVPLVESLTVAKAVLRNRRMAESLDSVTQAVKQGEGISRQLAKTGEFPPLAAHLIGMGEETGRLDAMFLRIAEICDRETRTAIKRFTSLFEPIVILAMGLIVGSLILSMLVAITSVNDVAGL